MWKCKNCKVSLPMPFNTRISNILLRISCVLQREHSANIVDSPKAYEQQDPAKPMNVITLDCRGLEFVEFKADVRFDVCMYRCGRR